MDGRKKNKGIKGNKGGGRASAVKESIRSAVINKSWDIINDFFDNKESDVSEKRRIAVEIAKRTIPQNIDLTSKGESLTYTEAQINAIIDRYNRSRKG